MLIELRERERRALRLRVLRRRRRREWGRSARDEGYGCIRRALVTGVFFLCVLECTECARGGEDEGGGSPCTNLAAYIGKSRRRAGLTDIGIERTGWGCCFQHVGLRTVCQAAMSRRLICRRCMIQQGGLLTRLEPAVGWESSSSPGDCGEHVERVNARWRGKGKRGSRLGEEVM